MSLVTNFFSDLDIACVLDIRYDKVGFTVEEWQQQPVRYNATLKLVLELIGGSLEASIWWKHHKLSRGAVVYP